MFKGLFISILGLFLVLQARAAVPESLMGSSISAEGIGIQVESGGCTDTSSFKALLERGGGVTKVNFVRVQKDPCLANFRYGVWLVFDYRDLGLEPGEVFTVMNPRSRFSVPQ